MYKYLLLFCFFLITQAATTITTIITPTIRNETIGVMIVNIVLLSLFPSSYCTLVMPTLTIK